MNFIISFKSTLQFFLRNLKFIIDFITSIVICCSAIIAFITFQYKYDSSVRDLYVKSCTDVYSLLDNIIENRTVTGQQLNKLQESEIYAQLYLHEDIVKFIKHLHGLLSRMFNIVIKIDTIDDDINSSETSNIKKLNEKSKYIQILQNYINELIQEKHKLPTLYRQHILIENKIKSLYKNLLKNQ